MHILVVSYWYHPEPVSKPHDFATEMARRGHRVTTITGFPSYPLGHLYQGYSIGRLKRDRIDGVDVFRVPLIVDHSRSGLRRILSYSSFALSTIAASRLLKGIPDVIWTYQIGLPGVVLSKLIGAPLIHEVQDLWPEWSMSSQMGIGRVLYKLLDTQERVIYRNAQAITTISEGFKSALVRKGVPSDKITVIPNWANEQRFQPSSEDLMLVNREEKEALAGRFNVVYGGNIGSAQALSVVLDSAEQLRDLPEVQFVLIGDGIEREQLERSAIRRSLANVRFLGSRRPDQMAGYLAQADALLIHLKQSQEYAITIPSKTYSYLAAGRPIIAAAHGDVAALITQIGAGITCPPESPVSLAEGVRSLYSCHASVREAMGRRGRESFLKCFSRQILADEYEALFQRILSGVHNQSG